MEYQNEIQKYLDVIRRRKLHILLPLSLLLIIITVVAYLMPAVYKSEATIVVETQDIPEEMVKTTVTGYIEERLQTLNQMTLTRKNLIELMNKHNLYTEMKDEKSIEEIVKKMRNDIKIETIQANVVTPRARAKGKATVAFKIIYQGKNPNQVAQVTNSLTSLYLEENYKNREEKATQTVNFLERQLEELRKEISVKEQRIADFKEKNLLALPELMTLNLQTLERIQRQIDTTKENIKNLTNRKVYLQGQLASISNGRIENEHMKESNQYFDKLESLRSQYLVTLAGHSSKHPDVRKLKKQVEALEEEVNLRDPLGKKINELYSKKVKLKVLEKKYTNEYPDIKSLKKEIASMEKELKKLKENTQNSNKKMSNEDRYPAYVTLKTQLSATEMDIKSSQNELEDLRKKYVKHKERIEITPKVEQQYYALKRGYENAKKQYNDNRSRLMAAKEAQELEKKQMAEKLTLIDPPIVPEEPFKPNRLAIMLLGMVAATGLGLGTGSIAEFMDDSVHSADELANSMKKPILSVIPYIETSREKHTKVRNRIILLAFLAITASTILYIVHINYISLEVLWYQVINTAQEIWLDII